MHGKSTKHNISFEAGLVVVVFANIGVLENTAALLGLSQI